jgi:beta-galactosidase
MADLIGYNGGAMGGDLQAEPPYDVLREADPTRRHVMTEGILNFDEPHRADWDHEHRWWKTAAAHWSRLYQRPWFCGGAMWVFADYSANGAMRWHGCIDYARVPYESYWFFQSQWSDRLMVHINCHWSWDDKPGAEWEVAVFTNGESVALWLNGRSLGAGRSTAEEYPGLPHPPLVWQVPWEPGALKAVARRDGEQLEDVRRTEGEPAAIRLNRGPAEIRADGRDVAFLTAVVVDGNGERCYRDFRELELEVRGAATLTGPTKREARGGVVGFAVRSDGDAAEIDVIARGAGLAEGAASLKAVDA